MSLFKRNHREDQQVLAAAASAAAASAAKETPAAFQADLDALVAHVNRHAGRFPDGFVPELRRCCDLLGEVVEDMAQPGRHLDVHAVVSLSGMIRDYLPTTVSAYLSVDPAAVDVPTAAGPSANEALLDQVAGLAQAAEDVLDAERRNDADALLSQGAFLRTKFSRSDLLEL